MMNNYDFNVIEEKKLSQVNGGRPVFSGGGSNPASGGDDAGATGLWDLIAHFGGR